MGIVGKGLDTVGLTDVREAIIGEDEERRNPAGNTYMLRSSTCTWVLSLIRVLSQGTHQRTPKI
jgi:hypothetical protein|eukprot:COSAG02_NODE_972_length_15544_cov_3.570735_11_plen_64_part_00